MIRIQDLYQNIEERKTEAQFIGGPFDGKITEITVKKILDNSVSIIMRDKSIYQFVEPFDLSKPLQFVFVGYQPPPLPTAPLTITQKVKQKILRWLMT